MLRGRLVFIPIVFAFTVGIIYGTGNSGAVGGICLYGQICLRLHCAIDFYLGCTLALGIADSTGKIQIIFILSLGLAILIIIFFILNIKAQVSSNITGSRNIDAAKLFRGIIAAGASGGSWFFRCAFYGCTLTDSYLGISRCLQYICLGKECSCCILQAGRQTIIQNAVLRVFVLIASSTSISRATFLSTFNICIFICKFSLGCGRNIHILASNIAIYCYMCLRRRNIATYADI